MKNVYILIAIGVILLLALMLYLSAAAEREIGQSATMDITQIHEQEQGTAKDTELVSNPSADVRVSEKISLPLPGSVMEQNVKHTVAIDEIKQGCFRQDCIPSVDDPQFVSSTEATEVIPPDSLGIALSYGGEDRFYPFVMLETREIVNEWVGDQPLLVTYCPLCGTGIVFDRLVGEEPVEFGVSGMLWQSNLLMYNRAATLEDRNLWSQVRGEAVVGPRAGEKLSIIPSDIMRFRDWQQQQKSGVVLITGTPRDPYGGAYFDTAKRFDPNFDAATSPLPPMTYVYGVEVNGVAKAYVRDTLPVGQTADTVGGREVVVSKAPNGTVNVTVDGQTVPDREGFWFSWVAAYPDTLLRQ